MVGVKNHHPLLVGVSSHLDAGEVITRDIALVDAELTLQNVRPVSSLGKCDGLAVLYLIIRTTNSSGDNVILQDTVPHAPVKTDVLGDSTDQGDECSVDVGDKIHAPDSTIWSLPGHICSWVRNIFVNVDKTYMFILGSQSPLLM